MWYDFPKTTAERSLVLPDADSVLYPNFALLKAQYPHPDPGTSVGKPPCSVQGPGQDSGHVSSSQHIKPSLTGKKTVNEPIRLLYPAVLPPPLPYSFYSLSLKSFDAA